jgi:hypothetical protein
MENAQQQQSEDGRSVTKLQKNTERYLAKKQMLTARKDECNRNIRDLGVLPEEAFEKYTNEKLDRVCTSRSPSRQSITLTHMGFLVSQEASYRKRGPEEVRTCQQEGIRAVQLLHEAT